VTALVAGPSQDPLEHVPQAVQAAPERMARTHCPPVALPAPAFGIVAAKEARVVDP